MFVLVLCALLACADAASRKCNGNIDNLTPTGMVGKGVAGSNQAVIYDEAALRRYRTCFDAAADAYCIQASVLAAIASRESRGGLLIENKGGYAVGYGLMQCRSSSGLACTSCAWDSCCHINMMTLHLIKLILEVKKKLSWSYDRSLQGGVAAYNSGVGRLFSWTSLDAGTTNGDYSNDVIARAKYLKGRGWD